MDKKYQTVKHDNVKTSIFRRLFEIQYELDKYATYAYQTEIKAIKTAIDELFEKMLSSRNA